jgi:predicted kinase
MKTKNLILVRGVSGSGKTTFAELMSWNPAAPVFAADDYFMVDGEYKFDGSKLKDAHADCQKRTENAMNAEFEKIFVANTFTREWEMKAYYDLAEKYGYRVYSIVVENRHDGVNEHGVPEEAVQGMRDRFEIKL